MKGFDVGLVVPEGLAAHGRGEAFDYLLGERTTKQAEKAIKAAAAMLLSAKSPVISVNGNVAALLPDEIVELSKVTGAKLEVNLFHGSRAREMKIAGWLRKHSAEEVLGVDAKFFKKIPEIQSNRRKVDGRGIAVADVVFVPLEDGDRTGALKKLGKKVIAVDLNPTSRTALAADITIVDNITRTVPRLVEAARKLSLGREDFHKIVKGFDNKANLGESLKLVLKGYKKLGLAR